MGKNSKQRKVKSKVDCKVVLAKYPVETYDEQRGKCGNNAARPYRGCQSHHVIQNSHFQYPRGTTLTTICPNYKEGDAPCIPLYDGTNVKTAHGKASKMQKADGKRYRESYREKGKSPTYQDAREDAKKQLMAKPKPGLTQKEAECILIEVDKKFEKMCPGITKKSNKSKLRPPGQRGKGLPIPSTLRGTGGRTR